MAMMRSVCTAPSPIVCSLSTSITVSISRLATGTQLWAVQFTCTRVHSHSIHNNSNRCNNTLNDATPRPRNGAMDGLGLCTSDATSFENTLRQLVPHQLSTSPYLTIHSLTLTISWMTPPRHTTMVTPTLLWPALVHHSIYTSQPTRAHCHLHLSFQEWAAQMVGSPFFHPICPTRVRTVPVPIQT